MTANPLFSRLTTSMLPALKLQLEQTMAGTSSSSLR